ncbi:MAG: hypothetical protein IT555_05985 [Acetobacteraceae bacterium]|nr:hypothetical protein [Acetobacteraceae bacterium]
MPAPATITPAIVAEVARRRAAREEWKVICADLRRRGLPAGRTALWKAIAAVGVREHLPACANASDSATQAA